MIVLIRNIYHLRSVTGVGFCEDYFLLALGFSDSILKVWNLDEPQKLRGMKPDVEQLADMDKESEDILVRMRRSDFALVLFGRRHNPSLEFADVDLFGRLEKTHLPVWGV